MLCAPPAGIARMSVGSIVLLALFELTGAAQYITFAPVSSSCIERPVRAQAADTNGDGRLDWQEFLSATLNASRLEREERLRTAFEHFDRDGNGVISRQEMCEVRGCI
jgi:Ca2+-binding EF-hand superfamily protein